MATYTYPTSDIFLPEKFDFGIRPNVLVATSSLNGAVQTVEMPGSRWLASITYSNVQDAGNRAEIEAFWAKVRGQANRVLLWHIRRPTPRGTIATASPTVTSALAVGATTCAFSNAGTGLTLLPGDLFSINSQLVMCTNATAVTSSAGSMTGITFSPPLRSPVTATSAVTLTRPTALFIPTSNEIRVGYDGYGVSSFTVDLVEMFT